MKKRILAVTLVLVMLLTAFPVHAASNPTFRVETVSAEAGDTVDVYIQIENNPGIASIRLEATYDANLTLTGISYNNALGGVYQLPEFMNSPVVLNWLNFMGDTNGDMYFVKLTFQVKANAAEGTYPVAISYDPENVYNIAEQDIAFAVVNGGVKVVDCLHRNKTVVDAKASDCKLQGWDTYKVCDGCGQLFDTADKTIGAIPLRPLSQSHTGGTATCVKKAVCTICGASYGDFAKHNYTSVVTAPTCTEEGYTTYTCTVCKDSYVSNQVAALNHSYTSVVTEPTCTAGGYTIHTCSRCQHTYKDGEKAKLGHSYKDVVTAPTCTAGGYTTHTCSRCQHTYKDNEKVALGHSYKDVVTAPTCTAGGYTTHTCDRCSNNYVDSYTDPVGHKPGNPVTENETRTEYDAVVYCSACGVELSREHVVVYIPGDINGDGKVNNKDASRLFQYLSGWDVEVEQPALDINADGKVNNKDASRLFQYLSGWDVEIY